jgi:hypothetical protein
MKIQVLTDIKDCIDGYNPIILENGEFNINAPENSISSILMLQSMEQIPYEMLDKTLSMIRRSLRMNGKLVIGGIDINCISRDLINKVIDSKTYNSIIFSKKGIYDSKELSDKIIELGLTIDKITLKGSVYEIHASRSS